MKKIVIKIKGMDCASDSFDIEKSVKKIKGITKIVVNYLVHKGFIECKDTVKEKDIIDAVKKVGFEVKEITYKS